MKHLFGGTTAINGLPVPPTVNAEMVYARFRFDSSGGLGPTGLALDGEVEDILVPIGRLVVSEGGCTLADRGGNLAEMSV